MSSYEHEGRRVEAEIEVEVGPQPAWEAFADPEKLAGWFVDEARGRAESGSIQTWVFERFGYEIPYRVIEAVPGEKVVYGPGSEEMPPFILEVTFQQAGDPSAGQAGGPSSEQAAGPSTRIRLVNSGFGDPEGWDEQYEGVRSGWIMALGALKEYLEHHDGEPRTLFMATRPADYAYEKLRPWYLEGEKLGSWLGEGAIPPEPGSSFHLELEEGETLSGRVLAVSDWEVAVSWEEIDGVLELKGFRQGDQQVIALRGWGWGMDQERAHTLEQQMERALERLVPLVGG